MDEICARLDELHALSDSNLGTADFEARLVKRQEMIKRVRLLLAEWDLRLGGGR